MSTLVLPNGTVLTQVTRQSCLDRLFAIPLGLIPYSNSVISPVTDRRADCTGLVSAVWDTPKQGRGIWLHAYSTSSFYSEKAIRRIDWADLQPGDSIGYYIPTAGDPTPRHGAIWLGGDKKPNGQYHVRDHGSGMGPKDREVGAPWTGWLHPDRLAPWRYVGIIEGEDDMTPEQDRKLTNIYAALFAGGSSCGTVASPANGRAPSNAIIQKLDELLANAAGSTTSLGTITTAVAELRVLLAEAADTAHPTHIDTVTQQRIMDIAAGLERIPTEVRDAVADLGEGGAAQVRADG